MFLCFILTVLLGALEEMYCLNMLDILSHLEDGGYCVQFNMQKLFILSTEYTYICCIIPRINSDILKKS